MTPASLRTAAAELGAAFSAAIDRCAQLGMFSTGPIDEVAYAQADAERGRIQAAWERARAALRAVGR